MLPLLAAALLLALVSSPALAEPAADDREESDPFAPPRPPTAPSGPAPSVIGAPVPAAPHLLGDWGGIRTALERAGITPTVQYIAMPAWNLTGGDRSRAEYAAQLTIGAAANLDHLVGIKGGTLQLLVTNRHGRNLNITANLDVLQHPQAIWGAGQIWRLSQLFYLQRVGRVEAKLGRMSVGEDFGTAPCFFESLYFCGIVPGHVTPNYWYNPPVSVWGARVKVMDGVGYTQVGLYEHNPTNLREDRGFYLGRSGAVGVLIPVERGFTTKLGGDARRAGLYKVGGWYDTSNSNDLVHDVDGGYSAFSGKSLARSRGRWGGYIVARQQVLPTAANGSGALNLFLSLTLADAAKNRIGSILVGGATYSGLVPGRPRDEIGLAIGHTRISNRLTDLEDLQLQSGLIDHAPQQAEWAAEFAYSIYLHPALSLRPNVQLYVHPGGRSDRETATVLGLGAFASF